jgi:uncharacterized membrane protein
MLDLRIPIGSFFALVGVIVSVLGAASAETRAVLTDANVNLYCGLVMLVFGVLLLLLARRAARSHS